MFHSFEKSTITICCLLGVNCLLAAISIYWLFINESGELYALSYGKAIIQCFVLLISAYLVFHLYKGEMKALKLSFWFCLLQIITIESETLTIGLNYGAKIGAVFEIGAAIVTIDVLALLTLLFIGKIIRGQKRLTSK